MPSRLTRWQHRKTAQTATQKPRTFEGQTLFAKVDSIYDGDTITIATRLKGEQFWLYKLRLLGLDTPEIRPSRDLPNRESHKAASRLVKERLTAKIPPGSVIVVVFAKEGKYGRLLGTAYTTRRFFGSYYKNKNINRWLIDSGYALPYDGGTKTVFSQAFLDRILGPGGARTVVTTV
jgi:endonuclease YncB( thermonuclease family)